MHQKEAGKLVEWEGSNRRKSSDNTHIRVKNPGNDPKTGTTSSTTKGREDDTSKKVGRVKMWFRRETALGLPHGEETGGTGKGENHTITLGSPLPWEEESPQCLALKSTGDKFPEFLQPEGLKSWNLKNPWAHLEKCLFMSNATFNWIICWVWS